MRVAGSLPFWLLLCLSFHPNCGYLLGVVEGVVSYALENIADEIFENLPETDNLEKRFSYINQKLQMIEKKVSPRRSLSRSSNGMFADSTRCPKQYADYQAVGHWYRAVDVGDAVQ